LNGAQKLTYYPAFDYLRIVLATIVAAFHSGLISWDQSGNFAVQVFFALSGWLIGGILLRSEPKDLPRFYFNRAARIWVPYLVAILLLISASLLKEPVTAKWREIFFYDLTFVYNFFGPPQLAAYGNAMPLQGTGNHFWSICAEEQFYLLAPFLVTLLPMAIGKTAWFWAILSAIALASPFWNYFGAISLGVFAAVLRDTVGSWQAARSARLALAAVAIASFCATYVGFLAYWIGAPISSISIVLFLARAGRHSSAASFVGGVSFPLYLNQWIGVFIANAIFGKVGLRNTWYCHISGLLISIAIATVLYLIIDRNVRKCREQFFSIFRGRVVAVSGFTLVAVGMFVGRVFYN
jgi:peptidoglycan/LPS O-acetylase OafA/YrhL